MSTGSFTKSSDEETKVTKEEHVKMIYFKLP